MDVEKKDECGAAQKAPARCKALPSRQGTSILEEKPEAGRSLGSHLPSGVSIYEHQTLVLCVGFFYLVFMEWVLRLFSSTSGKSDHLHVGHCAGSACLALAYCICVFWE